VGGTFLCLTFLCRMCWEGYDVKLIIKDVEEFLGFNRGLGMSTVNRECFLYQYNHIKIDRSTIICQLQ
jgi:hypothetical protein